MVDAVAQSDKAGIGEDNRLGRDTGSRVGEDTGSEPPSGDFGQVGGIAREDGVGEMNGGCRERGAGKTATLAIRVEEAAAVVIADQWQRTAREVKSMKVAGHGG